MNIDLSISSKILFSLVAITEQGRVSNDNYLLHTRRQYQQDCSVAFEGFVYSSGH